LFEHPIKPADSMALQLGFKNQKITNNGLTNFGLDTPVHSIVYFDVYRQVLKIIALGARFARAQA